MKKITLFMLSLLMIGTMMAQNSAERCENPSNTQVAVTDIIWDVEWTFAANAGGQPGVETDGTHIYCPMWSAATITRYDMDGANATDFTVSGASNLRDLAYDGTYYYGAAADLSLKQMDYDNETLISTISVSCSGVTGIRHIAYDPQLDGGNGGFWIGNWTELGAIDMTGGQLIANIAGNVDCYGSAYDDTDADNPCLWLFQQNGTELATFVQWDINTQDYTGISHEASDVPGFETGGLSGGACVWDDPATGKKLLIGSIQQTPNLVFAYEISGGAAAFTYDIELMNLDIPAFAGLNDDIDILGKIKNRGSETVTSFDVSYTVDGGTPIVYSVTGVDIITGGLYDFVSGTPLSFAVEGTYDIEVTVGNINGHVDEDPLNNTLSQPIGIVPFIPAKKVYGEEATGTWCGWCPRGAVALDYMSATYPETWIGVAVHNQDPMVNIAYNAGISPHISGYPNGLVDRAVGGINPGDFEDYYLDRINVISPATLELSTVEWDEETREISFEISSEFVVDFATELRFNAVIAEDSLYGTTIDWDQANNYTGGGSGAMGGYELLPNPVLAADMHYDHVAREILGGWDGTENSLPTSISAGDIITYTYTYTVPETMRTDKMHVIGLLIDQTTGEILNANSTNVDITSGVNEVAKFDLIVYPNPASSTVNVVLENKENQPVSIKVYDLMGRVMFSSNAQMLTSGNHQIQINVDNFSDGIYLVEVTAGNTTQAHKISVSK